MGNIAIKVENVSISYKAINRFSLHQSLNLGKKKEKDNIFTAVKGISFSVEEGEILGIIGKNGSGKSTLLKSIAGIFKPDSGLIDVGTHQVSLMSIGAGFMRELTGRENIMIAGLLLGFSPEYIKEKEDEVIEFSELGDFIDKPVRTYSSGMYSKLSFSITAMMEPDIMLIDEVLSVGDTKFKLKSLNKMKNLILDNKRTVIIVSHDLSTLSGMCHRVLWMHEGEKISLGETNEVLEKYKEFMS